MALAAPNYDDRVIHSQLIITTAWSKQAGLGPYLLLDRLSQMEHDRVFHDSYRDHVCHQLKVFLLGLYFFDSILPIRQQVLADDTGGTPISLKQSIH